MLQQNNSANAAQDYEAILANFRALYQALNRDTITAELIASVYDNDVVFEDCFHHISGLEELTNYFDNLYENVKSIRFEFHDDWLNDRSAMLNWTMTFVHPSLNSGREINVEGASKLIFHDGKIVHHKDYFDAGSLLYEHIPVLKSIIRYLKKRMV